MVSLLASIENRTSAHDFGKKSVYIEISNTFNTWKIATALIVGKKQKNLMPVMRITDNQQLFQDSIIRQLIMHPKLSQNDKLNFFQT